MRRGIDIEDDSDTPLDSIYAAQLSEHLDQVRAHLAGQDGPTPSPSFNAPRAFWTSTEKNLFFHALSVHSRARPDLIAHEIKTKTTTDVCIYLNLLEDATRNVGALRSEDRDAAIEVSDNWIATEEKYARALMRAEPAAEEEALQQQREEDMRIHRLAIRAPKKSGQERDRDGEKARKAAFDLWLYDKQKDWETEDALRDFDAPMLTAVYRVLREAEEAGKEDEQLMDPVLGDASLLGSTANPSAIPARAPDPEGTQSLVELSPGARRRLQKRLHMRKKRAEAKGVPLDETAGRLKTGRKSHKGASKSRSVSFVTETTSPTLEDNGAHEDNLAHKEKDDQVDPENQTVQEPQRPQKVSGATLPYKRLEKLEKLGLNAERLHEDGLGLLHPIGISKLMQLYNRLHDVPPSVGSQISGEVMKLLNAHVIHFTTQLVHRTVIVREQEQLAKMHSKVWRLGENQTVAVANVEHALSMMSSSRLSKRSHFKGLLGRLGIEPQEDSEAGGARERESQKDVHSKRRQQQQSSQSDHSESDSSSSGTDEDEDDCDDGDEPSDAKDEDGNIGDDEAESKLLSAQSLHRTIFRPFMRLPSSVRSGPNSADVQYTSAYMPYPLPSTYAEPFREEELMPEDTDTDALLEELVQEEKLDKRDREVDRIYEKDLWHKFNSHEATWSAGENQDSGDEPDERVGNKRKRKEQSSEDEEVKKGQGTGLRFCRPGGRIKSSIYIVDSD